MNVNILATCRDESLIQGTLLIFKTLRTGFPTANVKVFLNNIGSPMKEKVVRAAIKNRCEIVDLKETTIHHKWIEKLIAEATEPFWILDTDVIFWQNMERFDFSEHPLAGRRIPEWNDEFTNARTRARLHTCLLYFNPLLIVKKLKKYLEQYPDTPFNPFANLIHPLVVPFKGKAFFHDTCCLLYHAVGGKSFDTEHLECSDHLNFSTITDIVYPHLEHANEFEIVRQEIYKDIEKAKGIWRMQNLYYESRQ